MHETAWFPAQSKKGFSKPKKGKKRPEKKKKSRTLISIRREIV